MGKKKVSCNVVALFLFFVLIASKGILVLSSRSGLLQDELEKVVVMARESNGGIGPAKMVLKESARQVPTGQNPIHHNDVPVKPFH